MKNNRIEYLDSLRGLASVSVVIHHILLATPLFFLAHEHKAVNNWLVNLLAYSPLHMLWAGHEAVMLFFLLSGFVLALPFLNRRMTSFPKYLVRRFCRIYIPYIVSIGLSIALFLLIDSPLRSSMSANFNNQWGHDVSIFSLISYVFLLGFDTFNINGVTWSLVHEMRISIFFPFLMLFVIRYDWKKTILFGVGVSLLLWIGSYATASIVNVNSIKILLTSFGDTFYYTSFFVLGATMAKYRESILSRMSSLSSKAKKMMFILFIILYNVEWIFPNLGTLKFNDSFIISKLSTTVIDFTIASSVLILFAVTFTSPALQTFLNQKPLVGLGRISYSLYLLHIPILLATTHLLYPYLSVPVILTLVLVFSVLLSIVFYQLVEKPSMVLGKFLTRVKQPKEMQATISKKRA